jgi:4-hydroxybenzoyl-CoA reductase subunit alpha
MQESDVRITVPYIGGGFCGKVSLFPSDIVTTALSRKSGRPVKLVLSRDEVLIENRGIPPNVVELKTGFKKDGTLTAMECRLIANGGAYVQAPVHNLLFAVGLTFPYRLPNIKFEGLLAHTNHSVYLSQRGGGVTPARFVYEAQLDMIAVDLGLDPIEVRRRNALQPGDMTTNKSTVTSCALDECLQKVAEHSSWKEKRGKLSGNRGLGVACHAYPCGDSAVDRGSSAAFIHVHGDGTVTLVAGGAELGQGISTVMSQIVAEELGVDLEDIRITQPDTESCPYFVDSSASMGTITLGNAVKAAAADAKQQVLHLAAEKLGAKVEDIEMRQREVYVRDNPDKRISFAALARGSLYRDGKPILGKGLHTTEADFWNFETGEGEWIETYSFGAAVAEVEVDKETGRVKVLKATVAHDCGVALNPMLVEGQIEGQFQAGMGQAIYEERLMEKGHLLNPTFLDYRMPRSLDMPDVESILVETVDPRGPFGAKECGEGPQGAVAPAIANAVYDAIGVRINDLPITPEKVIKALRKKE